MYFLFEDSGMSNKKVMDMWAMEPCQCCWVWGERGSKWENNSWAVPKLYKNQVVGTGPAPGPCDGHERTDRTPVPGGTVQPIHIISHGRFQSIPFFAWKRELFWRSFCKPCPVSASQPWDPSPASLPKTPARSLGGAAGLGPHLAAMGSHWDVTPSISSEVNG